MTYRYVPRRLRMAAQLATLAVTAILGASVVAAPANVDPKLTEIERAMDANVWGYVLLVFGAIGFIAEVYTTMRHRLPVFLLVSVCHSVLFGVMMAYAVSSAIGVFTYAPWNFGVPFLAALVGFWHYIYVQRRPREPVTYVE
jgi:hypothetical protein